MILRHRNLGFLCRLRQAGIGYDRREVMRKFAFGALVAAAIAASSHAQTGQDASIDTVTVTAPDPSASEDGPDPGVFEIQRTGPTNFSLSVFYKLGGSASNGVDYETISSIATI